MSEMKHTPGPWVWRGKDGGLYQEGTTHRFGEAVLAPSYDYDSGIDTMVSEADMALIAAAPELLEALKMAQLWLDVDGRFDMQKINAAIAKAEGRS